MNKINYIRFDWAIKKLLRDKANFGVLEGFIEVFSANLIAKSSKYLKVRVITLLRTINSTVWISKRNPPMKKFLLLKFN